MRKCLYIILVFTGVASIQSNLLAQRAFGKFLTDTIQIGKPFEYALSFSHSSTTEVFFPDTASHFEPFQVIGLAYFPTQTNNAISKDSAIYTLVSFDLKKWQTLRVPIWTSTKYDCTAVYTNRDTVFLKRELASSKNAKLQTDIEIIPLRSQINFPLILLSTLIVIVINITIYLVFGKAIDKQWRLYLLARRNRDFKRGFSRLTRDITGAKSIENIEKAVILWKSYLQRLERKPVATYTTKEIIDNFPDEQLADALRNVDSVIYGGQTATQLTPSLNQLLEIALQSYQNKRATIKATT